MVTRPMIRTLYSGADNTMTVAEHVHAAGQWLGGLCDYERALPLDGRMRSRVRVLREQAAELGRWAAGHGAVMHEGGLRGNV